MKVLVTGAAGFIGQAVVQELLQHGHQVVGLARSDSSAEAITKAGAEVHRGDIEDLESLRSGAKAADGVIHLAFIHDFTDFPRAIAVDQAAVKAMGEAMAGTNKPLVVAGGTLMLPPGKVAVEDTEPVWEDPFSARAKAEVLLRSMSEEKQIRGIAIRLAPSVHGVSDKGFVPALINFAKQNGFVTLVGDGSSRWPTVHRLDAAVLFRLALENGTAGATYHATGEQGVPTKEIMETISKRLNIPVETKSAQDAEKVIFFFAHFLPRDNPVSSEKTQKELDWHPTQPGLIEDMKANYFS